MGDTNSAAIRETAMSDLASFCMLLLQVPESAAIGPMGELSFSEDIAAICEELDCAGDAVSLVALAKQVSAMLPMQEDPLGWMRREYTRLFAHPKRPAVIPYEGVYLDSSADRFGRESVGARMFVNKSALDAEKRYKSSGFAPSGMRVPADSITMELEFISAMHSLIAMDVIESSDQARMSNETALRGFVESHLCSWMPDFFEDLRKETGHPLYLLAANMGLLLCRLEKESLSK